MCLSSEGIDLDNNETNYYQQITSVAGVLAGLIFTGFVLVLSYPNIFLYPTRILWGIPVLEPRSTYVGLICALAIDIALFIMTSVMAMHLTYKREDRNSTFGKSLPWIFRVGIFILGFSILLITNLYTIKGAIVIFYLYIFLIGLWYMLKFKSKRNNIIIFIFILFVIGAVTYTATECLTPTDSNIQNILANPIINENVSITGFISIVPSSSTLQAQNSTPTWILYQYDDNLINNCSLTLRLTPTAETVLSFYVHSTRTVRITGELMCSDSNESSCSPQDLILNVTKIGS